MDRTFNSREIMFKALSGEKPDVLPAAPAYPSLFLQGFERAYYVEQYRRLMRGRDCYRVDHEEDTRIRAEALYQSCGVLVSWPDWIEVSQGSSREWAENTEIVRENGLLYYRDRESGETFPMHSTRMPYGGGKMIKELDTEVDLWDVPGELKSREDVDRLVPILTADELLARGDFDVPRRIVEEYGDRFFISTIVDPPYSWSYDYLGFQRMMLIQHDDPDLFHYLLGRILEHSRGLMEAWARVGIHGVYVQEVFSGADIISRRSYDEFVFEYNRPYFQHLHSLVLPSVHYVCGDALPRLERILEMEPTAVAFEESKKDFAVEIEDVVNRVDGRAVVFGNVDAVKFGIHSTMDGMAAEVKRQARIGRRARGFVVSTGSPFPLDTNPRIIDTLVDTAHSLKP